MKPSSRAWLVAPVLLGIWVVLGFFFDTSPHLGWLPKWALAASVLAPLGFIAVYTVQGLTGPGKWWQSDLGVNFVWLELVVVWNNGMLVWAQWFNHGALDTPVQAWCFIGGILAGAAIITWRSVIWLRNYRSEPPMLARVRELENENARLRERLGEDLTQQTGAV